MPTKRKRPVARKLAYNIPEFCKLSSISRSLIYLEIRDGNLPARKCRNRTIILHADAVRWLKGLPAQQPKGLGAANQNAGGTDGQ